MRYLVMGGFLLLLFVPAAGALDDKATPAEQLQALQKEFRTAVNDHLLAQRQDKADEAKAAGEKAEKLAGQILELAKKNPKEAATPTSLFLVASASSVAPSLAKAGGEATDLLLQDHLNSPQIGNLSAILARNESPAAEKALRIIMEKSMDKNVQGTAGFNLGKQLASRADKARVAKQKDADALSKEAEKVLEQVAEKYGDVKYGRGTLGDAIKGELYEMKNLSVGRTAPEIDGEDIDGKKFKLSDYRGKVILLDFWGHW